MTEPLSPRTLAMYDQAWKQSNDALDSLINTYVDARATDADNGEPEAVSNSMLVLALQDNFTAEQLGPPLAAAIVHIVNCHGEEYPDE